MISSQQSPAKVNIASASDASPPKPPVETIQEVPATNAGLVLAKYFAAILAAYLLVSSITLTVAHQRWLTRLSEISVSLIAAAGANSAPSKETVEAVLLPISAAYERSQSNAVQFHTVIIVNVLFPILTGLLGYIFANRTSTRTSTNQ